MKNIKRFRPWLLVLPVLFASCDSDASGEIADGPNRVLVQTIDRSNRMALQEVWRVGVRSDRDTLQLFRVRGAMRGPDGETYILDAGNHRVLVVDSSGALIRSFGREGEGPGEFANALDLTLRRDTVAVRDRDNRVHLFTAEGSLAGTRVLSFPDAEVRSLGLLAGTNTGWVVAATGYFSQSAPRSPPVQRARFFELDPSTGTVEPLGLRWRHESPGQFEGIFWLRPILQHRPGVALSGQARFIVADTPTYRLDVYSLSGVHELRVENEVELLPISDHLIDLWRASRNCPRNAEAAMECSVERDQLILAMERPPHRPVVGRIRGHRFGSFSVLRADLDANPFDSESPFEYDHFDSEGRFLGATTGLTPLDLSEDYLVALQRDLLGVESVVLFQIGGS